jgi:CHAT domain-containing protein
VEQAAVHLDVPLVLSDGSPLFSAWAFTPAAGAASPDGVVETSDLFEWTLPASLLALPRADAGGQGSGDALMVTAWAAVIAGTPTIVASRWTTDDRAGGWWNGFYTAWAAPASGGQRRDAASALQRGVRGLLAQPGMHPMDAAGIMVLGGAR